MRIAEIMTANPITVAADATVSTAAKVMRDHDLGSLPVVDEGRLVGFLTDRDIIVRCVANDGNCSERQISDIMSPEIFCCRDDHTPRDALELMAVQRVNRLPVIDINERLVGIVSLGKLAETSGEPSTVCETIKAVRQPAGID